AVAPDRAGQRRYALPDARLHLVGGQALAQRRGARHVREHGRDLMKLVLRDRLERPARSRGRPAPWSLAGVAIRARGRRQLLAARETEAGPGGELRTAGRAGALGLTRSHLTLS